jgi:Delta24-sterol reductase
MLYRALHASGESKRYIVQDMALPYETAESFIEYATAAHGILPLWLCPLQQTPEPSLHAHTGILTQDGKPEPMLNIGL